MLLIYVSGTLMPMTNAVVDETTAFLFGKKTKQAVSLTCLILWLFLFLESADDAFMKS